MVENSVIKDKTNDALTFTVTFDIHDVWKEYYFIRLWGHVFSSRSLSSNL